jgi:hypothetical protein
VREKARVELLGEMVTVHRPRRRAADYYLLYIKLNPTVISKGKTRRLSRGRPQTTGGLTQTDESVPVTKRRPPQRRVMCSHPR